MSVLWMLALLAQGQQTIDWDELRRRQIYIDTLPRLEAKGNVTVTLPVSSRGDVLPPDVALHKFDGGEVHTYRSEDPTRAISVYIRPREDGKLPDNPTVLVLGTGNDWESVAKYANDPKLRTKERDPGKNGELKKYDIIIGPAGSSSVIVDGAGRVVGETLDPEKARKQSKEMVSALRRELKLPSEQAVKVSGFDMYSNGVSIGTPALGEGGGVQLNAKGLGVRAIGPASGKGDWAINDLNSIAQKGTSVELWVNQRDLIPFVSGSNLKDFDNPNKYAQDLKKSDPSVKLHILAPGESTGLNPLGPHYLDHYMTEINDTLTGKKNYEVPLQDHVKLISGTCQTGTKMPLDKKIPVETKPIPKPAVLVSKPRVAPAAQTDWHQSALAKAPPRQLPPKAEKVQAAYTAWQNQRPPAYSKANDPAVQRKRAEFTLKIVQESKIRSDADKFKSLNKGSPVAQPALRPCPVCHGKGRIDVGQRYAKEIVEMRKALSQARQQLTPPVQCPGAKVKHNHAACMQAEQKRQQALAQINQMNHVVDSLPKEMTCTSCNGTGRVR